MERNTVRTTLASLFIGTTSLAVALACWVNYPDGEWNIVVTAAALAIVAALLTPFGIKGGVLVGVLAMFVSCLVVEKDPSGLGPFEIIFPIQLVVAVVPLTSSAAIGRALRQWLSKPS